MFPELCPVEESLPANWQYHFASYNSYEEAKDTTFEDCQELCDPGGQCNKAIIYRPETSSCLMFESADIFDSSSGSPSTNPNSKRGCIVGECENDWKNEVLRWNSPQISSAEIRTCVKTRVDMPRISFQPKSILFHACTID